jgi:hypothetical protein
MNLVIRGFIEGLLVTGGMGSGVGPPPPPPSGLVYSAGTITALYLQGLNAPAGPSFGPVAAGMTFEGVQPTGSLWPPTSYMGPLVNAVSRPGAMKYASGIYQVATPLVPGTQYTILAVIRDPVANPDDPGAHPINIDNYVNDPGDQVTLSGGIGTVSALVLATALRIS